MNQEKFEQIKRKAEPILRQNSVEFAGVFGSVARGQATLNSDIDIVVRYSKTPGLFDHVGLAQTLEDALQQKVDLVTEGSLHKSLAAVVKKDLQVLYGRIQRSDLY